MKEIVNYRHKEKTDFGEYERDGEKATFDNVVLLCIDQSDEDWYCGKPTLEKVPYDVIKKSLPNITPDKLTEHLIGKHCVIEKEAKMVSRNGSSQLSEKVIGIYFLA